MPTRQQLANEALQLDGSEVRQLDSSILRRYISAYQAAINNRLREYNIPGTANAPSGQQLVQIKRLVNRDITSIVNTYQEAATRQVDRILSNPDITRDDAIQQLEAWQDGWIATKVVQIDRASQTNAAEYANEQFLKNNQLTDGLFEWDAAPPVLPNSHQECIRRVGTNGVPWSTARYWQKVHPNCRHIVSPKNRPALSGQVWRG